MRFSPRAAGALAGVFAILSAAAVWVYLHRAVDPEHLASEIEGWLGVPVRIDRVMVVPWSRTVRLEGITVGGVRIARADARMQGERISEIALREGGGEIVARPLGATNAGWRLDARDVDLTPYGFALVRPVSGRATGEARWRGDRVEIRGEIADADVAAGEVSLVGAVGVEAEMLRGGDSTWTASFRLDATDAELTYAGIHTKRRGVAAEVDGTLVADKSGAVRAEELRYHVTDFSAAQPQGR